MIRRVSVGRKTSSSGIRSRAFKGVIRAKARRAESRAARIARSASKCRGSRFTSPRRQEPISHSVGPPQKRANPQPDSLTPAQQQLDQSLRQWRSTEAERLGLPQFFVLGTSTLRNIDSRPPPDSLAQLRTIDGLTLDKAERFGPAILELL